MGERAMPRGDPAVGATSRGATSLGDTEAAAPYGGGASGPEPGRPSGPPLQRRRQAAAPSGGSAKWSEPGRPSGPPLQRRRHAAAPYSRANRREPASGAVKQPPLLPAGLWRRIDKAWLAIGLIPLLLVLLAPALVMPTLRFAGSAILRTGGVIAGAVLAVAWLKAAGAEGLLSTAFTGPELRMIVLGALIGGLAPFCSCEVIPFIAALLAVGAPLSAVMAFWLASPLMDPAMFLITAGTLGTGFAAAKTVAAVTLGLAGGLLVKACAGSSLFADPLKPRAASGASSGSSEAGASSEVSASAASSGSSGSDASGASSGSSEVSASAASDASGTSGASAASSGCASDCASGCGPSPFTGRPAWAFWRAAARRRTFRDTAVQNALFLGKWLLLAYLVEALMLEYLPAEVIATVLGGNGLGPIALAAVVGAPAYLNGYATVPLVEALLAQGMSNGAAMSFVIAGGVSCIPAAIAVWALVKPRVFAAYVGIALAGAVTAGIAWNLIAR